ncbi:hypothetical protein [Methanonatronarchaeum sp. AMET-Sl]|uniref:hypothetical protein n=1 Tax=Methanonatronarchaeum sp. AMET-Sl TaxID=3037654 RepID=UPI00244E0C5C|nr:hypothetical protein [Methanonatronarchaeum sp. AMET-Sl]WGI17674.1 hypothetical protein QEN48_01305 [Methanonatronarchaeum sp. AMET-Sl]
MSYIEFIGPPGTGKSKIHQELIKKTDFYGGFNEDGLERAFLNDKIELKANHKFKRIYRFCPSSFKSFFDDKILQYYIGDICFTNFISEKPGYLEIIKDGLESVAVEKKKIINYLKHNAEKYQLGISTKLPNETLVLDEGFSQGSVSILWRENKRRFSLKKYFEVAPTPDKIIYINAPTDLCIERQRKRGNIIVDKNYGTPQELQKKHEKACNEVVNYLEKNGVEKIQIKNKNKSIKKKTDKIKKKLK